MFNPFRPTDPDLDAAITEAFTTLANLDSIDDKEKYEATLKQITDLKALQRTPVDIDPNKLAAVAGNLLVAVIVIKYEQTNVITTKVMSLLSKI